MPGSATRHRGVAALVAAVCLAGLAAAAGPGRRGAPAPVAGPIVAGRAGLTWTVGGLAAPGASVRQLVRAERGYTLLQPQLIGQTPAGFGVWVDPRAAHHWAIASNAAAAVRDLRRLHTRVSWHGYGVPAAREGAVRVREGRKGCGSNGSTVGMTWTYWKTLASGKRYAYRADVYLCPRLFRLGSWATAATLRHELGHAMGLGHTNYRYRGSYQVMNAVVRRGVVHYRSGDRRGLRLLARNTAAIKAQIPPIGALDSSDWHDDGTISFAGWALMKYFRGDRIAVQVVDNGRVVDRGATTVLRTDVNRAHDPGTRTHGYLLSVPWSGGDHKFCVTARSVEHPRAVAQLGCVTWNG